MSNYVHEEKSKYTKRPKTSNKSERPGAKTAPIDTGFAFQGINNEGDETNDYISSYNYYIYYNSIKPRDPRLPKPTYKPMPDLDFIRQGIREEDEPNNDFQYEEGLNNMMNSMTLGDRSMLNISLHGQGNGFNQNPLNYRNEGGDHFGNMMPNVNFLPNVNVNANLNPNVNAKSKFPNPSMNYFKHQNFDEYEDNQHFNISPYIDENPRRGKFDQMGGGFNSAGNFFPNNANNNFGNFYPINNNVNTNFFGNSGNIGNVNNFNLNPQYMNTQRGHINISNNVHTPNMYMNNNPNMYNMNYMNMNMNSNIPMNNFPNNSNGFNSTQNSMNMSNYSANSNYSTAPNEGFFTKKFHNNHHKSGNNSYSKTSIGFNTSLGNEGRKDRGQGNDIPTFEEILDNAISFSKDHSGSRLIQKKFEDGSEQEREKIFSKIQPELLNLCRDVFGNYVIQKILDHSRENVERKSIIVRALSGKFYDLTLHMYGCRVIQKFIEVSEYEDVQLAMRELQNYFSTCIEDQNGNHVMQKLIEKLKQGDHDEIVATAIKRVFSLCVHQYGCRVMQKLLEYCQDSERERILFHIYLRVIDLCQDQFGNYVIQHILDKIGGSKIQPIFDELKGKIFEMSIHKFASNVIEKCLSHGTDEQKKEIINEIILKDDMVHDSLLAMVKDKFGNYVVQKMIECSDQAMKENIIKRIISSQALKKRDGFSKHVISFIEKMGFSAKGISK